MPTHHSRRVGSTSPGGSAWPPEGVAFTNVPSYPAGSAFDGTFVPTGPWLESVLDTSDATNDAGYGTNFYIGLTTDSDLTAAQSSGAIIMPQWSQTAWPSPTLEWGNAAEMVDETVWPGAWWMIWDELDMFGGTPAENITYLNGIRSTLSGRGDTRPGIVNWGKGVAFWNNTSDAEAYVQWAGADIIGIDLYWYTDPNIAGAGEGGALLNNHEALTNAQARRACNYGYSMDRLADLGCTKPRWNFIEVARPWSETVAQNAPTITPDQIRGATWHSIIAGALGIMWFNHSFQVGTDHPNYPTEEYPISFHALRESEYAPQRAAVTEVSTRLQDLAAVIHAPTATGQTAHSANTRTLTKYHNGYWYIFAGTLDGYTGNDAFTLTDYTGTSVEVLYESRTLTLTGGAFTDSFAAEYTTHIYRIPATQ